VVRHDLETGAVERCSLPHGDGNSEPVFVPRVGAAENNVDIDITIDDGAGWVLSCVYRAATDRTDLIVLDASDIASGPVATVHLPRRIPAGFHGAWLAHDDEGPDGFSA
jgi:carotenoid cleavage dioxygenase